MIGCFASQLAKVKAFHIGSIVEDGVPPVEADSQIATRYG
jgi:hypothetical protein